MKRFSELGVKLKEDTNMFPVQQISITNILNCEIEILDYAQDVKTRYGGGRYVVRIRFEKVERKFFTNSSKIKESLDQIRKTDFPFTATIKSENFGSGNGKMYFFT